MSANCAGQLTIGFSLSLLDFQSGIRAELLIQIREVYS